MFYNILLIGRGFAKKKRFHIGIEALEYIIKEIPNCELIIISKIEGIRKLQNLVNNLDLENNIRFNGYASTPDIYLKLVNKIHINNFLPIKVLPIYELIKAYNFLYEGLIISLFKIF